MPVVEVCMRARLREGIAGLADPASFHLSAREDLTQGTDLAFASVMSRPIVILPPAKAAEAVPRTLRMIAAIRAVFPSLNIVLSPKLLLHSAW